MNITEAKRILKRNGYLLEDKTIQLKDLKNVGLLSKLINACNESDTYIFINDNVSEANENKDKSMYVLYGDYASCVDLKLSFLYNENTENYILTIEGLDITNNWKWVLLGESSSSNFDYAIKCLIKEVEQNITPLYNTIKQYKKERVNPQ